MKVATILKPWASVASDLSRLFDDERVRLAMSFQTKYLGMSPFHAPSLFTILAFLEYEHGIFHAEGGLGSITKRMSEIAIELILKIFFFFIYLRKFSQIIFCLIILMNYRSISNALKIFNSYILI